MVKLANAAPNPETVMIKLSHASIAVPAVPAPIRLHDKTCLTKTSLWHLNFLYKLHALHTLFVINFFNDDLRSFIILKSHFIIIVSTVQCEINCINLLVIDVLFLSKDSHLRHVVVVVCSLSFLSLAAPVFLDTNTLLIVFLTARICIYFN